MNVHVTIFSTAHPTPKQNTSRAPALSLLMYRTHISLLILIKHIQSGFFAWLTDCFILFVRILFLVLLDFVLAKSEFLLFDIKKQKNLHIFLQTFA